MEGVSNEAGSFAGNERLANLCWIYDNNHITIDGNTRITYSDDVADRFMGYGWNVTRVGDANDTDLLARAFETFRAEEERPTLIIVDSHIGYGSPHKQDTAAAHGEPLGEEEVRETKRAYGWPEDAQFLIPDGVYEHFADGVGKRGASERGGVGEAARRRRRGGPGGDRPHAAPRASGRVGRRHPHVRPGSRRHRDPQGLGEGAERDRAPCALAGLGIGRPHRVGLERARLRGRRHVLDRRPHRPHPPLRHPRARVGGDLQRPGADEAPPGLVDLSRRSPTTRGPRSASRR